MTENMYDYYSGHNIFDLFWVSNFKNPHKKQTQ